MEEYIYPESEEPRLQEPPTEIEKLEALFANIDHLYSFGELNQAAKLESVRALLLSLKDKIKTLGDKDVDVSELTAKLHGYNPPHFPGALPRGSPA